MNLRTFFIVFLSFLFVIPGGYSQDGLGQTGQSQRRVTRPRLNDGLSLDSGTIANQFQFIMAHSNTYQNNKVVKRSWLNTIKAHVLDSLKTLQKDLSSEQLLVGTQKDEIEGLKSKLASANERADSLDKEKGSISFLGSQMNKSAYKGLVWTIMAGLLGTLLFFLYRFRQSNVITVDTKKNLAELQDEFEAYKKRALEREQKVRRELQNVLNKRGEQ